MAYVVSQVLEIWNLVFMQFNREPSGNLKLLPAKHIDTGMGLERLTSILQGKLSNYDTDLFTPLFEAIQRISGADPYTGKVGDEDPNRKDMAYRVIADHARTLTFAITDGAVPSNEGRGYVLRRILRRAVRYGQQTLGAKPGFFAELVPVVVEHFKGAFPELESKQGFVEEIVADEEQSFSRTIGKGLRYFNRVTDKLKSEGVTVIPGEQAFYLYDTMGFPLDLTELMAEENGMTVDIAGFDIAMEEQKTMSRNAAKGGDEGITLVLEAEQTAWLANNNIEHTDDELKYTWFNKAGLKPPHVTVKAIFTERGFLEDGAEATGELSVVGVILDKSPFYSEAGGQMADTGALRVVTPQVNVSADEDDEETPASSGMMIVKSTQKFGG